MMRTCQLLGLAMAALAASLPAAAQIASASRVSGQIYGNYYLDTRTSLPLLGVTANNTEYFGSTYTQYLSYGSNGTTPVPLGQNTVSASGVWAVAPAYVGTTPLTDANYNLTSTTDFRKNHAGATISNFTPYDNFANPIQQTYCLTDSSGACLPGSSDTLSKTVRATAYANARSRWEDIYYVGSSVNVAPGSTATYSAVYTIDAKLGAGAAPGAGSAYFSWRQSDFQGNVVLGMTASYDAYSDTNYQSIYDPLSHSWSYVPGTGALNISQALTADVTYTIGTPFYVDSSLDTGVNENGDADVRNTITLTSLKLPANALLYVASGADYSGVASFGVGGTGGGGICQTLVCTSGGGVGGGGGGGGGGIPPVPEPGSSTMMVLGLGLLGFIARRRVRAASV